MKMGVVVLAARFILAGVLAVAAVEKLSDRAGSRNALKAFGILARTLGTSRCDRIAACRTLRLGVFAASHYG